jgi:hypothetical protein
MMWLVEMPELMQCHSRWTVERYPVAECESKNDSRVERNRP